METVYKGGWPCPLPAGTDPFEVCLIRSPRQQARSSTTELRAFC